MLAREELLVVGFPSFGGVPERRGGFFAQKDDFLSVTNQIVHYQHATNIANRSFNEVNQL
jgi:hypothetical protein